MLRYVGRPRLVFVIGDSHAYAFRDLLFELDGDPAPIPVITRALFVASLMSKTFSDDNGQLYAPVLDGLISDGLIALDERDIVVDSAGSRAHGRIHASKRGRETQLLFFCGDIDVRTEFLRQLPEHADFELSDTPAGVEALRDDRVWEPVDAPVVFAFAQQMIRPFFRGLLVLKNAGFERIAVHSLPPPSLSDDDFVRLNTFFRPKLLRYKAYLLFNHIYRTYSEEIGVRFIDLWPSVTVDGVLDQRYYLDGAHLNRDALMLTMERLLQA